MRAPIGFKFQSSNSAEGWGALHLDPLIRAGIPPAVMAIDMAGPLFEAQEKMAGRFKAKPGEQPWPAWPLAKQRQAALVYRHSLNDVPDYRADPVQSARAMWEYHKQKWPPELDRRIVFAGIVNEPATFLSRGEGYEHALRRVMINPSSQLAELDNSEWLAAHALELCRLALAAGVRFSVLGWSPGSPEPFQWRGPQMTALLDLLRRYPDELAIDCHEYSLEPGAMPESALIGRFRNIPAPWPSILISEFGWTLNEAPPASVGVGQILSNYGRIYAYPQVRGLAVWTLGKEGESWGNLGQVINGYLEPLTRGILATDFTPLAPPTPPTEGAMILDLSRWNGTLNAAKMKAGGVAGVILRAAAGATRDTMVDTYAPALKAAGIPIVGAYLYYHPYEAWRPQLDALKAVMSKHGIRRGYLDLEDTKTVPTLARDAETFMAALAAEMPLPAGKRHGVYTNASYWRQMGSPGWGAGYDLWIAAWTDVASPVVPAPWQRWTLWQYSNSGNGPAYGLQSARVDLNRFNGTAAAFSEWLSIVDVVDVPAAIRGAAAKQPGAGWHPTHALPLAAIRDGYLPVGPEFDVTAGGVAYRALRAYDRTGKWWVYYAVVNKWNEVSRIAL